MTPIPPRHAELLVITATLGASPWLEETVQSVQACAGEVSIHLLVAPETEVAGLQRRFPHCRVLPDQGPEGGLYGALNQGLQAAFSWNWRWMTFIADDDGFLPGFRELFRSFKAAHPSDKPAVWQGQVVMVDEQGRKICRIPYTRRQGDIAALVSAGYSPFNQQSMIYSRSALEQAGRFIPGMSVCADAAHWLSALERGAEFHTAPVPAAYFRIHSGQLSGQVSRHREEFQSLSAKARKIHGSRPVWPAVMRFRLQNLPLYWERFLRVGPVSGFGLLGGK